MFKKIKNFVSQKSDFIGISASFLCTVHCLLTPIFFMSKPLMYAAQKSGQTHHHSHDHTWASLDFLFLAIAFIAVWLSSQHTHHPKIKIGLWVGWILLTLGILVEMSGEAFGSYIMYLGSFSLISLHFLNRRYCRISE